MLKSTLIYNNHYFKNETTTFTIDYSIYMLQYFWFT